LAKERHFDRSQNGICIKDKNKCRSNCKFCAYLATLVCKKAEIYITGCRKYCKSGNGKIYLRNRTQAFINNPTG